MHVLRLGGPAEIYCTGGALCAGVNRWVSGRPATAAADIILAQTFVDRHDQGGCTPSVHLRASRLRGACPDRQTWAPESIAVGYNVPRLNRASDKPVVAGVFESAGGIAIFVCD